MTRVILTIVAALAAVLAGFYQISLKPKLTVLGEGRVIEPVGNTKCKVYKEVEACEKLVLHQPTGHLYMACSTQEERKHWIPTVSILNATGKSIADYVAVFDPVSSKITRLQSQGFKFHRGLSFHGMDVIQSKYHPSDIILYLINHKEPLPPARAEEVGADSVIEIFRTKTGSGEMHYVSTFKDPVIATPNDVVSTGDDESFYFVNDHGFDKTSWFRKLNLDVILNIPLSNVGYCHAKDGCKVAIDGLMGANGITKDKNGLYYVASSKTGRIYVLERQSDNTLVIVDEIPLDRPVDNVAVDRNGAIWGAGIPKAFHLVGKHFENPKKVNTPSSALKITLNKDQNQYFGEKYKVEKVFEDDGEIASGSTSAVYDVQRKKLYLHGVAAPHLTVCDL